MAQKITSFFSGPPMVENPSNPSAFSVHEHDCPPAEESDETDQENDATDCRPCQPRAAKRRKREVKKYSRAWLEEYDWLIYESCTNSMFCHPCKEAKKDGPWGSTGTSNFRRKSITTYARSVDHKQALAGKDSNQTRLKENLQAAEAKRRDAVTAALKCVYWMATEEVANKKYKSLVGFLQHLEVPQALDLKLGGNATYDSPHIFNQLAKCLSDVLVDKLKSDLRRSPVVGIGIDESTDRSQEKHVAVVVRYIGENTEVNTTFLGCKKLKDGTAETVFNATRDILTDFGVPFTKVVGLGADGASVMSGACNGVNALMKQENPFFIFVHCVCHRLALAVSQACKGIQAMKTLNEVLGAIYTLINLSPNNLQQFKDLAALLDQETLKFRHIFEIRWLSVGDSVLAVVRNYRVLMIFLEEMSANGNPSAIGLVQQLTSYKFTALLHLAADVLSTTNHLSRLFQYGDVSFAVIRSTLDDAISDLREMTLQNGPFLSAFERELATNGNTFKGVQLRMQGGRGEPDLVAAFQNIRRQLLENLVDNLLRRFPNVELLEAMQIFEPAAYPLNPDQLVGWGNNYLEVLLTHYGQQKQNNTVTTFSHR